MKDTECLLVTLPSGLRIVAAHAPQSRVEHVGVNVNSGARDESSRLFGISHFVEHTIFKGTSSHRSTYIINRLESIGGELNAYTGKEETVVYAAVPAGNLRRAATLIAELITESIFPDSEIERERDVVLDEIASYLDSPPDAATDEFEDMIFRANGLGHNILGSRESVGRITSEDCRNYLKERYAASSIVVFYYGPAAPEKVVDLLARTFEVTGISGWQPDRICPPTLPAFAVERAEGLHQAHTIMGARLPGARDSRRHAALLLTNILGGPGMNSILNMELREKRGLVYSVDANAAMFSDCGLMEIYFGCDAVDVKRCQHRISKAIERIADGAITRTKLEKAQKQYLGQIIVSNENSEGRALSLGRSVQLYNATPSYAATEERIMSVTPQQVSSLAAALLPLSTLTLR